MNQSILAIAASLGLLAPLAWALAPGGTETAREIVITQDDDEKKADRVAKEYERQIEELERALEKALEREMKAYEKKLEKLERNFDRKEGSEEKRIERVIEKHEAELEADEEALEVEMELLEAELEALEEHENGVWAQSEELDDLVEQLSALGYVGEDDDAEEGKNRRVIVLGGDGKEIDLHEHLGKLHEHLQEIELGDLHEHLQGIELGDLHEHLQGIELGDLHEHLQGIELEGLHEHLQDALGELDVDIDLDEILAEVHVALEGHDIDLEGILGQLHGTKKIVGLPGQTLLIDDGEVHTIDLHGGHGITSGGDEYEVDSLLEEFDGTIGIGGGAGGRYLFHTEDGDVATIDLALGDEGEGDEVRTFTFPGGEGKVVIKRSGGHDGEIEVETIVKQLDGSRGHAQGVGGRFVVESDGAQHVIELHGEGDHEGKAHTFTLPDGQGQVILRGWVGDDEENVKKKVEKKVRVAKPYTSSRTYTINTDGTHKVWTTDGGNVEVVVTDDEGGGGAHDCCCDCCDQKGRKSNGEIHGIHVQGIEGLKGLPGLEGLKGLKGLEEIKVLKELKGLEKLREEHDGDVSFGWSTDAEVGSDLWTTKKGGNVVFFGGEGENVTFDAPKRFTSKDGNVVFFGGEGENVEFRAPKAFQAKGGNEFFFGGDDDDEDCECDCDCDCNEGDDDGAHFLWKSDGDHAEWVERLEGSVGFVDAEGNPLRGTWATPDLPDDAHVTWAMPAMPEMPAMPAMPDMPEMRAMHATPGFAAFAPPSGEMVELQALMAEMRQEMEELRKVMRELRKEMKSLAKKDNLLR